MIDFPSKERYGADDLRFMVECLRSEDGCPWDKVQTHQSLRRSLLEECDELAEAIDKGDLALMQEELGDVWLQVIFHASIEAQAGHFTLDDVADAEVRKLLSRHPHVFGDTVVSGLDHELQVWEELKRKEKHQSTPADAMDAVCRTLPGLWRAEKVQKKSGLTFSPEEVSAALKEDGEALAGCLEKSDAQGAKNALGELLFTAVKAARLLGVDPEEAVAERCEEEIRAVRRSEAEQ